MSNSTGTVGIYLDSNLKPPAFSPIVAKDKKDPKKNVKLAKMIIADPSLAFTLQVDYPPTPAGVHKATMLTAVLKIGVELNGPRPYVATIGLGVPAGDEIDLSQEMAFAIPFVDPAFSSQHDTYYVDMSVRIQGNNVKDFLSIMEFANMKVPLKDVRKKGRMTFKTTSGANPVYHSPKAAADPKKDFSFQHIWFHDLGSTYEVKFPSDTKDRATGAVFYNIHNSSGHQLANCGITANEINGAIKFDASSDWSFVWLPHARKKTGNTPPSSVALNMEVFEKDPADPNKYTNFIGISNGNQHLSLTSLANNDVAIYIE